MKLLSVCVAVAAAFSLLSGIIKGGGGVLGLAADPGLASIGGVGLILAGATSRSPLISPFLRVFSMIFAVEYVVTGLAYVAVEAEWWPPGFAEAAPPASLPVAIAIFGLLVHLISFIPVIRQITRLADPYFVTDERGSLEAGRFGARQVIERRFAASLIAVLVVINQLQVGINIRLSFFNRDWFNAIQNKDQATFWSLLIGVFCFWAAIAVVSNLVEYYTESVLKIRWRRWMTERYYGLWLDRGSLYRATLLGQSADNPDQRIAEDVRNFLNSTYAFSISLLSTVSTLVSFSIILWTIPVDFSIPGTGITVPGLPFFAALVFSVVGTWLTHLIGRPLVRLEFRQERFEADFRFALARLREYCEQVALLRGENAERRILGGRFGALVSNYYAIVSRTVKLTTFTATFFQANAVIPYIIVAPYFFLGKITLGQMTQTAGAFGRVEISPHILYRALPFSGVLQGCRRASDDISFGRRRGASARHKTAAHRTRQAFRTRSGVARPGIVCAGRARDRTRGPSDDRSRRVDPGVWSFRLRQVDLVSRDRRNLALWTGHDRLARRGEDHAVAAAAVYSRGHVEDGGGLPFHPSRLR